MWMVYRIERREGDLIAYLRSFVDGVTFPRGAGVALRVLTEVKQTYQGWVSGAGLGRVIIRPLTSAEWTREREAMARGTRAMSVAVPQDGAERVLIRTACSLIRAGCAFIQANWRTNLVAIEYPGMGGADDDLIESAIPLHGLAAPARIGGALR